MQREGYDGFPDPESTETAAALALPTANHGAPPLLLTIMALHSLIFTFITVFAFAYSTGPPDRMSHRKWTESKQQLI